MGNFKLIEHVKDFLFKTTNIRYDYVLITAGANQAINLLLRVYHSFGINMCYISDLCYPYYPHILKRNNFTKAGSNEKRLFIDLLDYPSNPEGKFRNELSDDVIWDSVYYNDVFMNCKMKEPKHKVLCGSMSKVFGLAGIRIGWIATQNYFLYERCFEENKFETCSVSKLGQDYAVSVFEKVDYNQFSLEARNKINNNRDELNKIKYLLGDAEVPQNGMFYCGYADKATCSIIERVGIQTITLKQEQNADIIRFNLAQDNQITANAVKDLLKTDRRK
jgi:aspartate/methionine/tyrosine aminotransferase